MESAANPIPNGRASFARFMQKYPCAVCLAAGIIYSGQFWAEYTAVFAFPGLAVFYFSMFSDGGRRLFRKAFCFGMGFYVPLYYWFSALYPFEGFGFTAAQGIMIIAAACIGISLLHSFATAAVLSAARSMPRSRFFLPFACAALWTAAEWVLSLSELGFSWGKTAIGQASFLPVIETASLFGSYFIAFAVSASAFCMGEWLIKCDSRMLVLGCGIIALNITAGTVLYLLPADTVQSADIAIVQGNITTADKWSEDYYGNIVDTYVKLTAEAADNGAELVFLPESPIPRYSGTDCERLTPLAEIAKEKEITVLTGVLIYEDGCYYNSIVSILPDGSINGRYDKRHPVPFGESVPYESLLYTILPSLENLNLSDTVLTAGDDTGLISVSGFTFAPLVCFDSIFSECAREAVRDGADAIFVATNDSWYKDTRGVYEHRSFSVLRAVENGRYVVRAANTGISCITDTKGNVLCDTRAMERTILYGSVSSCESVTLYSLIGDIWLYVCFAVILCGASITVYKKIRSKRKT